MKKLNLVLPGLFWYEVADYDYLYKQLSLPLLSSLLAKSRISLHNLSYSDFIYGSLPENLSLASYYAKKIGVTGYQNYILIEPTHLRVDRDRLLIAEPDLLQLSEDESRALIKSVNQHFDNELTIFYLQDNLWLMGIDKDLSDLVSYPIIDIIGENIDEYLPTGNSRLYLLKIINEIQMLFFDLPINKQRNDDELLVVNSIWLFDKMIKKLPFGTQNLLSNNCNIGESITNLSVQLKESDTVIIDKAYYPVQYRDSFGWISALNEIEDNLISLVHNKLKSGDLHELNIFVPHLNQTIQYSITRKDLIKFWKRSTFDIISQNAIEKYMSED